VTRALVSARRSVGAPARWVERLLPEPGPRRLAARVLAGAAAVLLVAVVALTVLTVRDSRIERARAEGTTAVLALTPRLLTYDYRTLADDAARAQAAVTGAFAEQYRQYADQMLAPNAKEQNFVTKATVRNSAVVSADTDQVVVLVFLDQATTSKALTAPRLDNVGVRVTATDVDGKWLISQLDRL